MAALAAAFAQVTLGGVVRVTGSGLGCPDWPLCQGRLIPESGAAPFIEFSHRLVASVLGVLILAVAATAWVFYRVNRWILISSVAGLALVVVAALLGAVTVWTELAWWVRLLHLAIAEAVVACMVVVLVGAWRVAGTDSPRSLDIESDRFNVVVLAAVIGVFAVILWGSYMVGYGAGSSCGTWPLCRGSLLPDGTATAIHMGHRFLTAMVGALVFAAAALAWPRRQQHPEIGWAGLALALLFGAQVFAGAATVWAGFSAEMRATHLSLATLVWIALVLLAALAYVPQRFALGSSPARPGPIAAAKGVTS